MAKIDEVAEAAGVSISTVSYALSGKRPVSAETRRRVNEAVVALNYSPNAGARMLAGSRTNIFGLTEPLRMDTHTPTHMAFVLATAIAARRNDYDVLLLTDEQASAGMGRVAASGLVDAILVLDVAPDDERVALSREIDTPTIFVGVPDDREGLICVDLDFEAATALAVGRLAHSGHAAIGLIGQPARAYTQSNFPPRVRVAFEQAADRHGIRHDFRASGDALSDFATTKRAVAEILDSGATAILIHAAEDVHEFVLAEIGARDLTVPRDVSIVSVAATFDTTILSVLLDTIPLVPAASCDLAVDLALRALAHDPLAAGLHLIPPTYIDRGSIGRPCEGLPAASTSH